MKSVLRRLGPEPAFTLVDVGAMGGIEPEWRAFRTSIRVLGFEPDPREYAKLRQDPRSRYYPYALSDRDGRALDYHVTRKHGASSVFPPNAACLDRFPDSDRFKTIMTFRLEPAKVRTLDSVLLAEPAQDPDFLKLDTQGGEKAILEGGTRLLERSVSAVKVEVEFLPLYTGQPLFPEVDALLRARGFELIDLRRLYWKRKAYPAFPGKGQLVHGDALYFKGIDRFLSSLHGRPGPDALSKTLRFAVSCLVYRMHDYAMALLQQASSDENISPGVLGSVMADIRRHDRWSPGLRFPGSGRLVRPLLKLAKLLSRSDRGFSDADPELGNRWAG